MLLVGAVVLARPRGRILVSPSAASSSSSSSAWSVLLGLAGGVESGDLDPGVAASDLKGGGAVLVFNHGGVGVGKVNAPIRGNLRHVTSRSVYDAFFVSGWCWCVHGFLLGVNGLLGGCC